MGFIDSGDGGASQTNGQNSACQTLTVFGMVTFCVWWPSSACEGLHTLHVMFSVQETPRQWHSTIQWMIIIKHLADYESHHLIIISPPSPQQTLLCHAYHFFLFLSLENISICLSHQGFFLLMIICKSSRILLNKNAICMDTTFQQQWLDATSC